MRTAPSPPPDRRPWYNADPRGLLTSLAAGPPAPPPHLEACLGWKERDPGATPCPASTP